MANFTAKTGNVPDDFGVEQESIMRRRKLLDALTGQAMGSQVVGHTGQALGQGLMKVLTAVFAANNDKELQAQQSQLSASRRADVQRQLNDFMTAREGTPGQTMTTAQADALMNNDIAPTLAEPVKANPKEALYRAMASQHPELQAIGQAGLKEMMSAQKKTDYKDHIMPNGTIQRTFDDGRVVQLGGNYEKEKDKWSEPFMVKGPNGPVMVQKNLTTGQFDAVDKAAKVSAHANASSLQNGQKAGMAEWAKLAGKTVGDMSEVARSAQGTLRTLDQMDKMNQTDLPGGPAANASVFLQNLAQQAGIKVDTTKLANAEDFNSVATQAWMQFMNQAGGARGLVKEESEKIANALPSLMQSPQGRAQVIRTMRALAEQQIADAREAQKQYGAALTADNPQAFTFGLGDTMTPKTPNTLEVERPASNKKPRVVNW